MLNIFLKVVFKDIILVLSNEKDWNDSDKFKVDLPMTGEIYFSQSAIFDGAHQKVYFLKRVPFQCLPFSWRCENDSRFCKR